MTFNLKVTVNLVTDFIMLEDQVETRIVHPLYHTTEIMKSDLH